MHIHAQSRDEPSQVFRANCDQSTAFSNSFFARLFIRVSLSRDVERPSEAEWAGAFQRGRAGLSSDFARPSEAEQAANLSAPAQPSRPFRALQRGRAGSSGHFERPSDAERARAANFERPCGSERARPAISSLQRLRCGGK